MPGDIAEKLPVSPPGSSLKEGASDLLAPVKVHPMKQINAYIIPETVLENLDSLVVQENLSLVVGGILAGAFVSAGCSWLSIEKTTDKQFAGFFLTVLVCAIGAVAAFGNWYVAHRRRPKLLDQVRAPPDAIQPSP